MDGLGPKATLSMALSGGGYRAALFHLGALRCLHEMGVLPKIEVFSSVSGGSILAAHLANVCGRHGGLGTFASNQEAQTAIEKPLIDFVRRDIRTGPALVSWAWLILGAGAIIALFLSIIHLISHKWGAGLAVLAAITWFFRGYGGRLLGHAYRRLHDGVLNSLPETPRFIFCATDVVFGVMWSMRREEVGDYQVGWSDQSQKIKVAWATAASSCFPPVFFPISLSPNDLTYTDGKFEPPDLREKWTRKISLTDGGVYDNLGLEPLWKTDGAQVLVCDGGGPLPIASESLVFRLILRYAAIIQNQALALRKRMLIDKFKQRFMTGTYWGLASSVSRYETGGQPANHLGYSAALVDKWIAPIRTDLAFFTPEEVGILMNHGYTLAYAAIRTHCPDLSAAAGSCQPPFPKLMDEELAQVKLKASYKLFALSRWWPSLRGKKWYFAKLKSYT